MKNKILTALFVCLFAAIGLSAQSYYSRSLVTLDTITNTEADTILVGPSASTYYTFNSNFAYIYVLARTSLSGTANTTMVLQESNVSTGGAATWYTVSTASGTGATVTSVSASNLFGRRHRLILTGTGTQSTSYGITATLKKVN
jgi:hypothetical protein